MIPAMGPHSFPDDSCHVFILVLLVFLVLFFGITPPVRSVGLTQPSLELLLAAWMCFTAGIVVSMGKREHPCVLGAGEGTSNLRRTGIKASL